MQKSNSNSELYYKDATELAEMIRRRVVSSREVMAACLARIELLNPQVNAICTLREAEDLLREADAADALLAKGGEVGALHGLPIAIKDLTLTKGLRTTYGSLIYKDFIPHQDQLFVARIKSAGAIVIGKTNTPEFGAGSHTFNKLFGLTRNPYNLDKSAGAAAAGRLLH